MQPSYDPSVFDVASLKQAKAIILTAEGLGTDARWERETPWLADLAVAKLGLSRDSRVLDYGCGVGRIARALIGRSDCVVFGMDLSARMRALAPDYVSSPRFRILEEGVQPPVCSAAIAVWVLQHAERPEEDLERIAEALCPNGKFFLVNNIERAIPVSRNGRDRGFVPDTVDLDRLVLDRFRVLEEGHLPPDLAPLGPEWTYWKLLRAR